MKKKILAISLLALLAAAPAAAKVYDYYIKCKNGTEHRGMMNARDDQEAFEVLAALSAYYCGVSKTVNVAD